MEHKVQREFEIIFLRTDLWGDFYTPTSVLVITDKFYMMESFSQKSAFSFF